MGSTLGSGFGAVTIAIESGKKGNLAMGGTGGTIRGKTKLEVYKKFRASIDRKAIEESTGLFMDAGNGTKPDLYRSMKKDDSTGEWVLYFHFGK